MAELEKSLKDGTPQNLRGVSEVKNRRFLKWSWPDVIWLLSLFVFMFTHVHGGAATHQKFLVEPTDQIALVGTRVTFQCRTANRAGLQQWTKDGFGLGLERNVSIYSPRYSIVGSPEEGDYILQIDKVDLEDNGQFQCQVTEAPGHLTILSRKANLTVIVPPDPPYIVQGNFIETVQDQAVNLECISYGGNPPAEITWVDGNKKVLNTVTAVAEPIEDGFTYQTKSLLTLNPSWEHHNKIISCQAQNTADRIPKIATINVEVKFSPVLNISLKTGEKYLREGEDARILCDAYANPPPQIYRWFINDIPIIGDYNEEMVIFNVTRKRHNAVVKCEVTNAVGKSSKTKTLEVTYPPTFRTTPKNVEAEDGTTVTLSCDVDGYPQPSIKWLFNEPKRIEQVKGRAPNVKIPVNNDTAGRYLCRAKVEDFPEIEAEATVLIKGPPRILSNRTQFGLEGEDVRVECLAISIPIPDDVRWYFDEKEIQLLQDPDVAIKKDILLDGSIKSTIVIRASQAKHYGTYNCSVTNEFGNANAAIILKPLMKFPVTLIMICVSAGISIFAAFVFLLIMCNRRRRQTRGNNQINEKPDVSATPTDMYKESDRSSNISDLKIHLPNDGNYELDYSTSDRSDTKVGLPLAGPVRLPNIRHNDHLMNFCYSNDYSDPTYSDHYFKLNQQFVYDYPQGYAPPSHLRVQSASQQELPAPNRSLQGSLTRSIDTTSTLPLSGNASQSNSLQRMNKSEDETDDINRLGLPVGVEPLPTARHSYAQQIMKNAVDLRFAATYGNPHLRNSSLGGEQVHTSRSVGTPAPPPYSAVRHSVATPNGTGKKQATHV